VRNNRCTYLTFLLSDTNKLPSTDSASIQFNGRSLINRLNKLRILCRPGFMETLLLPLMLAVLTCLPFCFFYVCSTAVNHWFSDFLFRVRVTLRLTVSQPVSLGVETLLGLMTRFLVLHLDYYGLCSLGGALGVLLGLSFVGSLCHIFCRVRIFTLQYSICTICTRPLSVQAL
jgi:hypothetical protein